MKVYHLQNFHTPPQGQKQNYLPLFPDKSTRTFSNSIMPPIELGSQSRLTENAINLCHDCKNIDFAGIVNGYEGHTIHKKGPNPECALCDFLQEIVLLHGPGDHHMSFNFEIGLARCGAWQNETYRTMIDYNVLRGWISTCEQRDSLPGMKCHKAAAPLLGLDSFRVIDCRADDDDGEPTLVACIMPAHKSVLDTTWATRGWTYQEGALSKRRLVFTKHQVVFECQETQSLEALCPPGRKLPCLLMGEHVREYMTRNSTFSKDVLDAFRGVLKHYRKIEGKPPMLSLYGAPVELNKRFQHRVVRRPGFPSWTWLGWKAEKRTHL
ncbi:hypothetical protein QBC41DRAFT_381991, partial [Cercophora samala]